MYSLTEQIEQILPQTQCRQCGCADCNGYATALASGLTPIDRCAMGGQRVVLALAELLGCAVPSTPLVERPAMVAFIDEALCIGCTLCRQSCPVDAIVGAAKQLHTVLREECTGCELCRESCPVNCITLLRLS